jgi:hypothetical protein
MEWISRRTKISIIGITFGVFIFGSETSAGSRKYQTYRRPEIDMPVSLAMGTVRTPEFLVKRKAAYLIMIQEEKLLPFADMMCMIGLTTGPLDTYNCNKEPLLQVDWTVWDDGHIVAQGSVHSRDGGDYAEQYVFKHLGHFMGESGKKYVLEAKFTKDGAALNVTNPHLIVIMTKPTDW